VGCQARREAVLEALVIEPSALVLDQQPRRFGVPGEQPQDKLRVAADL
jgi:hypothetical protein